MSIECTGRRACATGAPAPGPLTTRTYPAGMTASPSPAPPQPGRVGRVTVVVIGAGQAGLSAAYHLRRRGFVGLGPNDDGAAGVPDDAPGTFVVLDAETVSYTHLTLPTNREV